jgi:hypothetical protein
MRPWKSARIIDYYAMALAEGEGAGSAYEYLAKDRVLRKVVKMCRPGGSVLIAGLPELYGYSLDCFSIAAQMDARVVVIDDRIDRLESLRSIVNSIQGIYRPREIDYRRVSSVDEIVYQNEKEFRLAFSCEVIQRVPLKNRKDFLLALIRSAEMAAVFAPNGDNPQHAIRSGLQALNLSELRSAARGVGRLLSSGYVDMPPFPPGIKRTDNQRNQVLSSTFHKIALRGLEKWCVLEGFIPEFLQKKFSHIVYILLQSEGSLG